MLGLRFDRIEEGYVDSFTGDPALRRAVADEPAPEPAELARQPTGCWPTSRRFPEPAASPTSVPISSAPTCGRWPARPASSPVNRWASSMRSRRISMSGSAVATRTVTRAAHARIDEVLGGSGPLADRMAAHRSAEEIPPKRLEECIHAFSSALRDTVRASYPLPDAETSSTRSSPTSPGRGSTTTRATIVRRSRSTCRRQAADGQPAPLVATESYPGHHTEHCRKEAGLVAATISRSRRSSWSTLRSV